MAPINRRKVRQVAHRIAGPMLLPQRKRRRRAEWEQQWSDPEYDPPYELGEADVAVQRAVADGWFRAGMRVLDIGCGTGHNVAFLAEQGLHAVGIDFAPSVIERARQNVGVPNASFAVVDVVETGELNESFDALLDRGCLHGIDSSMHRDYVRNVVSWARPQAPFLLIMRTKGAPVEEVVAGARKLLEPHFTYVGSEELDIAGPRASRLLQGVAMRFTRTS